MELAEQVAALADRVAVLEAKEAIGAMIHRYCEGIRLRDDAALKALFVPDATYELRHIVPGAPRESVRQFLFEGVDTIVGGYDGEAGASTSTWPMIHNLRVEVDGDEARSRCVMASAIWPYGKQFVGWYDDRLRRVDGEWRFAARTYYLIGEAGGHYAAEARDLFQAGKAD